QSVEGALSRAREAMRQAASGLEGGQQGSAAEQQKRAVDELRSAAEAAAGGTQLTRPSDRQQAQDLSREQSQIKDELLRRPELNKRRGAPRPSPSLDRAGDSARSAQGSLEEGDLDQAERGEQEAERNMRQAMKELSDEEEQYQRLRAEELLFRIAEE